MIFAVMNHFTIEYILEELSHLRYSKIKKIRTLSSLFWPHNTFDPVHVRCNACVNAGQICATANAKRDHTDERRYARWLIRENRPTGIAHTCIFYFI